MDVTDEEELAGLREALDPATDSPADSMLRALELSHRTYRHYLEAARGGTGRIGSESSSRSATGTRSGGGTGEMSTPWETSPPPWRSSTAPTPSSCPRPRVGAPEDATPLGRAEPELAPLAAAGDPDGWRVADFRPLRPLIHAGLVTGVTPELERWIFGFDAALLIGDSRASTFDGLLEAAGRSR